MKRSIIIVFIAFVLLILILWASNSVVRENRDFQIRNARNEAVLKTTHLSYLISEFVKERLKVIDIIASWANPFWAISPETFRRDILDDVGILLKQYPGFDSIQFLNPQGVVAWGVPESRSMKGIRFSKDIYDPNKYRRLFEESRMRRSAILASLSVMKFDPFSGRLKRAKVLLIVAPVYRNKTYLGSLMAILRPKTIGRRFSPRFRKMKEDCWALSDAKGNLMYTDADLPDLREKISLFIKRCCIKSKSQKAWGSKVLNYDNGDGKLMQLMVSYARLTVRPGGTWYVVQVKSLSYIGENMRHWLRQTRIISIFAMAIMVFAAIFLMISFQRSERKLDNLNQKYRDLLDNLPVGTFTFDSSGRIDYINQRGCEILGYTPEEIIGKDRLAFAWEKERAENEAISRQRLMGERKAERYRSHMVHKSGKIIDVEIYASPVSDAYGRVQGVRVMFTDITHQVEMEDEIQTYTRHLEDLVRQRTHDLRESEALYRSIFETSVAIIYIHQDDRFKIMNKAGMAFFGFKTQEEMLQASVWDTVPEGERERRRDNALRRLSGEDIPSHYESLVINKGGDIRVVECNFQRIYYSDEPAILAILFDITERKRLEAEILHSEKLKSMGQLATGVAHDFNNILSGILGRIQLLKKYPEDTKMITSCIQLVEQAVTQGANTIKRIQEFTRVRRDHVTAELIPLHQIIEDSILITRYSWKDQAQKQGVTIQIEKDLKDENQPLSSELREAFMNLILNAVDAMPLGGVLRIKTQSTTCNDGSAGVRLVFEDTGKGMSPEVLKHVREPFYTTKGDEGTGLGLSIVSEAVKRLGGTMEIESKKGKGTKVILEIPWHLESHEGIGEAAKPVAVNMAGIKGNGSLLVVDDEPALTQIFEDLLAPDGIDVVAANSGEEGLSIFLKEPDRFSIVFTDLGMPKMNGWELIKKIREVSKDIPIVLMTGWGLEISDEDIRNAEVTELTTKPVTIKTIRDIVSKYLGRP